MNTTATQLRPTPPPLPATTQEMLQHRKVQSKRTINDHVEDVYLRLCEDETYASLIFAIYDEQAVEKSLDIDDFLAAQTIRAYAKKNGIAELADESLAAIHKAHQTVLRRYQMSRKERRNRVGDTVVRDEDNKDTNSIN